MESFYYLKNGKLEGVPCNGYLQNTIFIIRILFKYLLNPLLRNVVKCSNTLKKSHLKETWEN